MWWCGVVAVVECGSVVVGVVGCVGHGVFCGEWNVCRLVYGVPVCFVLHSTLLCVRMWSVRCFPRERGNERANVPEFARDRACNRNRVSRQHVS